MSVLTERLNDLRVENGYMQADLAEALNVSPSAYGYYERGIYEPSLDTLKRIAEFYGVTTDYLVGAMDTPHPHVSYSLTKELHLSEAEMEVVKKLKTTVLAELSEQPEEHTQAMIDCWRFVQDMFKKRS